MNSILTSITLAAIEASVPVAAFWVVAVIALGSLLTAWQAHAQISRLKTRWRELLKSSSGTDLEDVLNEHLRDRLSLRAEVADLKARTSKLEEKMRKAKRHLGLVRYDAFGDVGGEQSFAMAIYDDDGNGAILTSLVGRTDCRVYCKSMREGTTERELSEEERKAMLEAANKN